LPDAGRAVGKGLREFKRALSDAEDSIQRPADEPPPRDAKPKRLVE
jgi:Sec-independent protein translocase protein TatA